MGWTNDRAMATRDGWADDAAQVTDIEFADAVADPIGRSPRVYDAIGVAADRRRRGGDAALARRPARASLPARRYAADDFGLSDDQIDERFADVQRALSSRSQRSRRP